METAHKYKYGSLCRVTATLTELDKECGIKTGYSLPGAEVIVKHHDQPWRENGRVEPSYIVNGWYIPERFLTPVEAEALLQDHAEGKETPGY
jgi:hypothetical protein